MTRSRAITGGATLAWLLIGWSGDGTSHAQTRTDRQFVGTTKCAACHFNQYKTWKSSAHGKAFDILPAKYRRDASCLKCHTTGWGEATTLPEPSAVFVTGVNCEACHGPGSEHVRYALRLVEQDLTELALDQLRGAIQRASLERCIDCHQSVAHGSHPGFDRELPPPRRQSQRTPQESQGFFSFQAHATVTQP